MSRLLEGRVAAAAFRWALRSPMVSGVTATLDRLAASSTRDIEAFQRQRLADMLHLSRRHVPAYRHPSYAGADLREMPVLSKDDVRRRARDFRNRWVPARQVTTGGTSGRPLVIHVSLTSFFTEWAHIAYCWRTAGIELTDPKITFRGSTLGRGFSERPIFYQATYNHFAVSPFHLNDATFRSLLDHVRDFRPRCVWGYPSAITPFARWLKRTGPHPELSSIRAVLLASEGAFEWQVRLFREVFDAPVVQWYGQSEKVAFGSGCPTSDGYHVLPTYGLVEALDGRIIATGFTNAAMPLVRYDTEDAGRIQVAGCRCGLPFEVLTELKGRWDQALLWGKGSEPISTSALNFHDPIFVNFDRFQFRQDKPGRATLLLTVTDDAPASPEFLEEARARLQARVGSQLDIDLRVVEPDALLSERGKVLTVDQRCNPGDSV